MLRCPHLGLLYHFFPFEILHCKRQWSHLIENRSANMQGQNNNSIKSLSHPIQTTEVEMKISCLYFGHVSYSAVGVSPPFYLGQRDNLFPTAWEIFLSFCKFAKKKKKEKKKTPSAWLCEKREFAEHFHMFFSPCINFQCCTLSGDLRISPSINLGDAPDGLEQHCTNLSTHWLC